MISNPNQKDIQEAKGWCECPTPYLGAQPAGTRLRCERCTKNVRTDKDVQEARGDGACVRCGEWCLLWFAPNEIWNRVVPGRTGLLCPYCFIVQAAEKGINVVWQLQPVAYTAPQSCQCASPSRSWNPSWTKCLTCGGMLEQVTPDSKDASTPSANENAEREAQGRSERSASAQPSTASREEDSGTSLTSSLERRVKELEADLAKCYRLTGADPDGDEDWRLAPHAVAEVQRLRTDSDVAESSLASARREIERLTKLCDHRLELLNDVDAALTEVALPRGITGGRSEKVRRLKADSERKDALLLRMTKALVWAAWRICESRGWFKPYSNQLVAHAEGLLEDAAGSLPPLGLADSIANSKANRAVAEREFADAVKEFRASLSGSQEAVTPKKEK